MYHDPGQDLGGQKHFQEVPYISVTLYSPVSRFWNISSILNRQIWGTIITKLSTAVNAHCSKNSC